MKKIYALAYRNCLFYKILYFFFLYFPINKIRVIDVGLSFIQTINKPFYQNKIQPNED